MSRTLKSLQGRRAGHTEHKNSVALVADGANLVAANPGCLPHTRTLRVGKGLANLRCSLAFPLPTPGCSETLCLTSTRELGAASSPRPGCQHLTSLSKPTLWGDRGLLPWEDGRNRTKAAAVTQEPKRQGQWESL